MKSKLATTLISIKGQMILKPKEYPDWYGIPDIGFIWKGTQSDPYLEYNRKQFNSHIVEDTMWERYHMDCKENGIMPSEDDFTGYMLSHKDEVYELCNLVIKGM